MSVLYESEKIAINLSKKEKLEYAAVLAKANSIIFKYGISFFNKKFNVSMFVVNFFEGNLDHLDIDVEDREFLHYTSNVIKEKIIPGFTLMLFDIIEKHALKNNPEDVFQELCLKVTIGLYGFNGKAQLSTYIYNMASHRMRTLKFRTPIIAFNPRYFKKIAEYEKYRSCGYDEQTSLEKLNVPKGVQKNIILAKKASRAKRTEYQDFKKIREQKYTEMSFMDFKIADIYKKAGLNSVEIALVNGVLNEESLAKVAVKIGMETRNKPFTTQWAYQMYNRVKNKLAVVLQPYNEQTLD